MQKILWLFFCLFFSFEVVHSQDLKALKSGVNSTTLMVERSKLKFLDLDYFMYIQARENILAKFTLPCHGKVISNFGIRSGSYHAGIDLKMTKGDTIYASFSGQVSRANYFYGYGNLIILDHAENLQTYYGHLSAFLVKKGDTICIGEPIGLAGATGRATTSHLHFEIRENEKPYDPDLVFDFGNFVIREEATRADCLANLFMNEENLVTDNFASESTPNHYIVRSGDSLWDISHRFKVTVQTLCLLNNLSDEAVLQIGQVLKLLN